MSCEMIIMGFPQAALRAVVVDEEGNQIDGRNCWFPDLPHMVSDMAEQVNVDKCTVIGPDDYIEKVIEIIEKILNCPIEKGEVA